VCPGLGLGREGGFGHPPAHSRLPHGFQGTPAARRGLARRSGSAACKEAEPEETPSHPPWGGKASPLPEGREVGKATGCPSPGPSRRCVPCQHPPSPHPWSRRASQEPPGLSEHGAPRMPGKPEVRERSLTSHRSEGFPAGSSCRSGEKPTCAPEPTPGRARGLLEGYEQGRCRVGERRGWVPSHRPRGSAPRAQIGTHRRNVAEGFGSEQRGDEKANISCSAHHFPGLSCGMTARGWGCTHDVGTTARQPRHEGWGEGS